jgi:hypothetical protein
MLPTTLADVTGMLELAASSVENDLEPIPDFLAVVPSVIRIQHHKGTVPSISYPACKCTATPDW